ncbi:hypothetical protein EKN06_12845 [Croceicoccus ponticola]|uniref:Uncharacterized protein n=2 Tax=Croceicoccus ponticola TaxID=2217664 RepID=A0A437GW00_9SPHN|nr:hypothetical protein EKN06_12845 [Croceicoccus ponticola]
MKWAFWIFASLYALAMTLFLISLFGWFGQDQDPLSAVFLLPLGLPWNIIADKIGLTGFAFTAMAPAINAGILYWLWKR